MSRRHVDHQRAEATLTGDVDGLGQLSALDRALLEYFEERSPFVALMVEGAWGAGKTHVLRERGPRLAARADKQYISLSAAGLQTRDELERALFFAASPILNNGYAEALGVFTRAAMRWAKIEPSELKPNADLSAGRVVVVLDDLERFAGGFKVVLGFVIDLVDNNGLHVVVVASDQKFVAADDFVGEWKEKVVGRTVRVLPTAEEMLDVAISGIANRAAADKLASMRAPLLTVLQKSQLNNFRATKHAIRELAKIIEALGNRFDELRAAQSVLLEGILIGLLELKRDASRVGDVAEFFSHADFGLAHQVVAMQKAASDDASTTDQFVSDMLERYEGTGLMLFPGGAAVSTFFARGVFEGEAILPLFDGLKAQAQEEEAPSVLSSNVFALPQEEFVRQAAELVAALQGAEYRSVGAIARIYVAMKYWSERRIIALAPHEVAAMCVDAIARIPPEELADKHADIDVFWFRRNVDSSDTAVTDAIEQKVASAYQIESEQCRRRVLEAMAAGEDELEGLEEAWTLSPLFIGDVDRWVAAFTGASSAQLFQLLRLLSKRSRIGGAEEHVCAELPNLRPLAQVLRASISRGPVLTLLESQREALAEALEALASRLERAQALAAQAAADQV